jgi:hypothetical protein
MGALLLSGCEIGPECLIAAGSVVTEGRRIPPRSVVMGVPGKVVRQLTDEELRKTHASSAHYLEMAQRTALGAFPPPWTKPEEQSSSSCQVSPASPEEQSSSSRPGGALV